MSRRTVSDMEYRNNQEYSNTIKSILFFMWIFFIIVLSWVTVDYVARAINNFTFYYLGLDEKSPWDTFIIAITVIAILFTMIIFLKNNGYNMQPEVCNQYDRNNSYKYRDIYDNHSNITDSSDDMDLIGLMMPFDRFNF